MKDYNVEITETLSKNVTVKAGCPLDARDIVEQDWRDGNCALEADSFQSVEFTVTEIQEDGR